VRAKKRTRSALTREKKRKRGRLLPRSFLFFFPREEKKKKGQGPPAAPLPRQHFWKTWKGKKKGGHARLLFFLSQRGRGKKGKEKPVSNDLKSAWRGRKRKRRVRYLFSPEKKVKPFDPRTEGKGGD